MWMSTDLMASCQSALQLISLSLSFFASQCRIELFRRSFRLSSIKIWNSLPSSIRNVNSLSDFKQGLYENLLSGQSSWSLHGSWSASFLFLSLALARYYAIMCGLRKDMHTSVMYTHTHSGFHMISHTHTLMYSYSKSTHSRASCYIYLNFYFFFIFYSFIYLHSLILCVIYSCILVVVLEGTWSQSAQ